MIIINKYLVESLNLGKNFFNKIFIDRKHGVTSLKVTDKNYCFNLKKKKRFHVNVDNSRQRKKKIRP
jgi:hypothetical protein